LARPHTLNKANPQLPAEQVDYLHQVDSLLALPPIDGPKPWSDNVERAAIWHCTRASTPVNALCAAGVAATTAQHWTSEEPPEAYRSACVALVGRLKSAHEVCSQTLLGRIYAAADDPKHWTAAAWIMERSRGYVVKQDGVSGPTTVVNIGQVVINGKASPVPVRDLEDVVDADSLVVASSTSKQLT
jgi:hypothetical protein